MNPLADAPPPRPAEPTPCDRCGTFEDLRPMRGQMLCAPCSEKVLHVIEREELSVGSLLSGVWMMLKELWLPCLALVAIFELPLLLLTALVPEAETVDRFSWFITIIADGAMIILALRLIEGREATVGIALSETMKRWGAMIWASILSNLITLLFTLLLIVPGVLRALSYAVILPVVLTDRGKGADALSDSAAMMEGHRAPVFVTWLTLFAAPFFFLALYVGVALFFQGTFSEPPEVHPGVYTLIDLLGPAAIVVGLIPMKLLPAVLFAKVRRLHERRIDEAIL
ncbi:MAG: hypothetical protein P1V51_16170 [Deltaproteobacteria bacterium]|nr:hypothetical protein [Deltaproteobacteria bacterium]